MEKGYKFRLYPNKEQELQIQKTFGCCRFVYNYYLSERIRLYDESAISPTWYQQDKELNLLKQKLSWLREVDACALRSSIQELDASYRHYYQGKKTGAHIGLPKYRKKRSHHRSYTTKTSNHNIAIVGRKVKLPKLGLVKCSVSKEVKGRILSATVSQNPSGKYYVSICCTDVEIDPLPKTGAVVGVDLGIKDLAITSDGVKYPNNRYTYEA